MVRDLWALPTPSAFLADATDSVWSGGATLACDASVPQGLVEALARGLSHDHDVRLIEHDGAPLEALARGLGVPMAVAQVAASAAVALVDLRRADARGRAAWSTFLPRLREARGRLDAGLSLLAIGPAEPPLLEAGTVRLAWPGLRSVDAMVWAELHRPARLQPFMASLAGTMAATLCAWRLDLIPDLVTQRFEDLVDPTGWLDRQDATPSAPAALFDGRPIACPLSLARGRDATAVRLRIWRAHLAVAFPWIEERRLEVLAEFRSQLVVDEHQRAIGVTDPDGLELGAIAWQLERRVSRGRHEGLRRLAAMRNALAHRQPLRPDDLRLALAE